MASHAPRSAGDELPGKVARLAQALGYDDDPCFITPDGLDGVESHLHSLSQAFTKMGVVGCFGFHSRGGSGRGRFSPALYLASAPNEDAIDDIHRMVWSQGVVPLLLVGSEQGVQLREAFRFTRGVPHRTIGWEEALGSGGPGPTLGRVKGKRLKGSLAWKDYTPAAAERVDSCLMRSIRALSEAMSNGRGVPTGRPDLVNAVIGKMIYLFVLVDRGTVDQDWIKGLRHKGAAACPGIRIDGEKAHAVWPAAQVWRLLDGLDRELNGSVFPVPQADRALISEEAIHRIRRVIRNGDAVAGADIQTSFLDVSFATLRTETISAMYELFLKLEEGATAADEDGAFYTPPFLADYILDELDGYAPLNAASRILDPSAGSGIFLVGCFRRIAEACAPPGGWTLNRIGELRELLTRCIFGVERQSQAANVTRFSLYLTLLDYAGRSSLPEIRAALDGTRLFPPLTANVVNRDFFDDLPAGPRTQRFTHVVGNPPWGKLRDAGQPANTFAAALDKELHPVDQGRVEEAFIWKAMSRHLEPTGAIAFLMSTKCFITLAARRFPRALASAATIVGVANLSHFRYRLFDDARSPATAVFLRAGEAQDMDAAWVHTPLLSSQPISAKGDPWSIIVSGGTMSHVRHAEFRSTAWSRLLMLSPYDRRYASLVVDGARAREMGLGDFLARAEMIAHRGGTPGQTGISPELILGGDPKKPNYYRTALGFAGRDRQTSLPFARSRYTLARDDVEVATPPYDRLFGGDMLVVTRHMVDFDVVERPAAFNSTVNLVAFSAKAKVAERPARRRVLEAIARYLRSDLAQYLFALVGKTWLLDSRRLELGDLLHLPFPFENADDLASHERSDPVDLLVKRFRIEGSGFKEAAAQYNAHRLGYKDSQVPEDAQSEPDAGIMDAYLSALGAGLSAALGPGAMLRVQSMPKNADFRSLSIVIGTGSSGITADVPAAAAPPDTGFNSGCVVRYDPGSSTVHLTKPLTIAAWTLDRAYGDRLAIVAAIARS